jgi:rhodanese-related sulfurtransferase
MAAGAAAELGYTNLMIYQNGIPDWLMNGYRVKKGKLPGTFR